MLVSPISCSISDSFFLSGFAFVYFDDDRDAEDAIRGLDSRPFGYDRRRLSVEWARVQFGQMFKFCQLFFFFVFVINFVMF